MPSDLWKKVIITVVVALTSMGVRHRSVYRKLVDMQDGGTFTKKAYVAGLVVPMTIQATILFTLMFVLLRPQQ